MISESLIRWGGKKSDYSPQTDEYATNHKLSVKKIVLKADFTLSPCWRTMATRWRKFSHSALIAYPFTLCDHARWSHEVNKNVMRCEKMAFYDGHTKGKMDTRRSQREYESSQGPCAKFFFWQTKDVVTAPEGTAEAWTSSPRNTRWQKMPLQRAWCLCDQSRIHVKIFSSVLPSHTRDLFKNLSLYKTFRAF